MLVYLAADEARLDELDSAVREYLGGHMYWITKSTLT